MTIRFFDLAGLHAGIAEELNAAFERVSSSGRYVLGPELGAFEEDFARYCGCTHGIGVGSGLDALRLILEGYGVGAGSDVIVPAHTFIATWLAVSQLGARVVPVDPNPATFNVTAEVVEAAVTPETRAIIVVHIYGQPVDVQPIRALADRLGVPLIEDAAQAHGARYRGEPVGSLGHAAAFSFYPGKNLGALGDGGAVVTGDADLADRVRALRNYGSVKKYEHEVPGWNSRLDELQAAFLRVKLAYLDAWNARRREIAAAYSAAFRDLRSLDLPQVPDWAEPVWHQYVVRHAERGRLQAALRDQGIETQIHYPVPPHRSRAFAPQSDRPLSLPVTESLCDTVLSLPIGPELKGDQVAAVIDAVRAAV